MRFRNFPPYSSRLWIYDISKCCQKRQVFLRTTKKNHSIIIFVLTKTWRFNLLSLIKVDKIIFLQEPLNWNIFYFFSILEKPFVFDSILANKCVTACNSSEYSLFATQIILLLNFLQSIIALRLKFASLIKLV